jgi:hypothetical protein
MQEQNELLIDKFQKLINQSVHFGLNVHDQETKYLNVQRKKVGLNDIDIDSKYLEQLKSCKYLGSVVNGDNSSEEEIE